jgi:hypothetical protein
VTIPWDPVIGTDGGVVAVAVPVRNEAERLARMLRALSDQVEAPPFTLCLFMDNCEDGTAEVLTSVAGKLPYAIAVDCCDDRTPSNAGAARARAMALALRMAPDGLLLTTDADSAPAPNWIAANLAALKAADVVAGRIALMDGAPQVQPRVARYYDSLHALRRQLDPVSWEGEPTHHWTSAASLGCSARVYRDLGGFGPHANGEDAAFSDAASRAGYRVRRDGNVVVRTSSRRHGRASGGFATHLSDVENTGKLPMVVDPRDEAWRFRQHAAAREAFRRGDFAQFAADLALPLQEARDVAASCRNDEAFAARIVGQPPHGLRLVDLALAEARLATVEPFELEGVA